MASDFQRSIERTIVIMGYATLGEFLKKFFLPLFGIVLGVFFAILFVFPGISIFYSLGVLVIGMGIIFVYPYSVVERKKASVNNNMHLFITYAGTIATMQVSRAVLFKRISQKKVFGEISDIAEKILYLSKEWNLGFAVTCRKLGPVIPSKILGDFLDRFAVMMDFGENLQIFLTEEQTSVMDDYATEYMKSLETIKLLQDVFISLTMAVAFGIAIGLLLPLLMGISINVIVAVATLAIFLMDVIMVVIVKAVIPEDKLYHDIEIKDKGYQRMQKMFLIFMPLSAVIFIFLFLVMHWAFLFALAVAVIPLFVLGVVARGEEEKIYRRDVGFPTFVRTLGSATEIRSGAVIASLNSLRIHDFGLLNEMVINLYRRLRLGSDKFKAWRHFAGETGSNLIFHFSRIFSESIYLGGNAEKTGDIVSKNFQKLLSLRKQKNQLAAGLRGAFYGSLIGLAATSFVSAQIVTILAKIFGGTVEGGAFSLSSIFGTTAGANLFVDINQISLYVGLMIVIHAIISAILLKIVDGGTFYAALFDISIMIWIGALTSWLVPKLIDKILPDIDQTFNETTTAEGLSVLS
ncbi:archaellar assembly protein FlaJ [Candidatus Woesearchaeota archaeon]|nr:MAG: archaellar assembly protein FlaJ [Candidatus Woesearchaeota archaeon]